MPGAELPLSSRGRAFGEGQGAPPPEVESSVAFEAPAKEPNLTLVADSFLQFMLKIRLLGIA